MSLRNIIIFVLALIAAGGSYYILGSGREAVSAQTEKPVVTNETTQKEAPQTEAGVAPKMAPQIAVVDVEMILAKSKAAMSVQKQIDEKRKGFLAGVEKAEKSLRDSQAAIEKESKSLSKDQLIKKAQEFEKKRLEARKDIQTKKAELDKAYTEAMNVLTKNIYDVCQKIADAKKIDLIITRQNIIVGSMKLDITAEVLKQMNETLPELKLK